MILFREKYKNANRCISSEDAYERVKKKLEKSKKHRISWQHITSVAACLVIAAFGISVYEARTSQDAEIGTDIIAPASETGKSARIYVPEQSVADVAMPEKLSADLFIIEESAENFEEVICDDTYEKREINGAAIMEKYEESAYECWIKKDDKVTKITATDISYEEKEDIINSIVQ